MKKLQTLITFLFVALASPSSAYVYDACEAAITKGDTAKIQEFSDIILETKIISPRVREKAENCVSAASNTRMVFRQLRWVEASKEQKAEAAEAKRKKEVAAEKRKREAEETVAELQRQKIAADARQKVKDQLTSLTADLRKLEKQKSCVQAKSSNISIELDAITKRFEQQNQSLILNDTHEVCTKVYASKKSEALLNQSCVDAFNQMGHPNLVFSEGEQKAVLSAEVVSLLLLELSLREDVLDTQIEILEVGGIMTGQAFNQKLSDDLAVKSCAEFGYEGIYLD